LGFFTILHLFHINPPYVGKTICIWKRYIIYIGPPEVDIQYIGPEGNISAEA
jgi:hypothetical protein